ncbi:DUF3862 domain-containing protein [Planococcus plakortidis]
MKKVFKVGCLGILGLVALIVVAALVFGGGEESATTSPETESSAPATEAADTEATDEEPAEEEPAEEEAPADEGVLTSEKYDQITSGMSYEEVVEIIGSEGTVMSETGEAGSEFHTVMYEWDTDGFMSAANFMFQGNKLQSKSQIGVSDSESPEVSIDQFNQISNGMTTTEVFEIVGGEGEIISESGEKGDPYHTVMYSYPGSSGLGSNVTLMFQGDKLESKSQFGLE